MQHEGRIVFVTRKYPPAIGGMETLSENLYRALGQVTPEPRLIALGRPRVHLIWWAPLAAAQIFWHAVRGNIDQIIVGDALLFAIIQPVLSRTTKNIRTTVFVHGLDLTFGFPGYRSIVRRMLRRADRIVANSTSTRNIALGLGMDPSRVELLHPGLDVASPSDRECHRAREKLRSELPIDGSAKVLLTLGRLVRRKGGRWFVREVLPRLDPTVVYVIAGRGPEYEPIHAEARRRGLDDRVILPGLVDDPTARMLMLGSDLFVQPNIAVPGDVEGFGLATVEAALRATPVVAAELQGLQDAVVDGMTGYLYPPGDADAATAVIEQLLEDPERLSQIGRIFEKEARARYSIERLATDLESLLRREPGSPERLLDRDD